MDKSVLIALLRYRISLFNIKFVVLCMLFLLGTKGFSQDIEPRRWTPLKLGTHILGAGYGNTSGKILFDPLLQAEDVTFNNSAIALQYIHPFKIGNKLARLDVLIPFSIAHWEGLLSGVPTTVNRNGFADPRIRLSVHLIGLHAMGPKEMREFLISHPIRTSFGASIAVSLPLGQYFEEKLLNLGQNQFIFRPQIGMVHYWGNWSYELTGSVFLYTKNTNFSEGKNKKKDAVFAMQTHLVKRFKSGMWASLSVGYGLGGQSIVNNQPNNDERADILGACSFGFVLTKKQTVNLSYIRTQTLKDIGADLNSFVLSWSALF